MSELTKIELKAKLETAVATVTFTKADGKERVMKCTLQPSSLPARVESESKIVRAQDDNLLSVWDLENSGWRSFKLDTVKNVVFA